MRIHNDVSTIREHTNVAGHKTHVYETSNELARSVHQQARRRTLEAIGQMARDGDRLRDVHEGITIASVVKNRLDITV